MKKKSGKSISDRRSIMSKNTEALTRGALGVTNSKHLFPLEKKKITQQKEILGES